MSIQNVPEEILDKIKKLLESTNGRTQAELENIQLKVQEMLVKYNLKMSDVNGHSLKGKRKFQKNKVDLNGKQGRHDSNWLTSLYHITSKYNFCRAIHIIQHRKEYDEGDMVIIGEEVNVEIVLYLIDHLYPKILDSCTEHWKIYGPGSGEKRNTFRRGFLTSCVAGIGSKLKEQFEAMQYANNQCTALVRVQNTELNEAFELEFPNTFKNKRAGKTQKSVTSKILGFNAGVNMEINKGLDGNNPNGYIE